MLNIMFGWRKASKCKKLIKRVQCRLKLEKNKRICIVKQLKKDVAELLKHGHQQTAFQRVEQVVIDENMVQVYDLLFQFCEFVIINLPYIRKHRDCPNDIKEAVSALIFSSARFGELPELLSIRNLFSNRYGHKFVATALQPNLINTQIIEGLEMKSVPNDVKYRFLDEIATTFIDAEAEAEPLFLEYKPHFHLQEQNQINNVRREEEDNNKLWLFGMSKKEMDDIQEFISPVIKDGSLQDQRFFVFKSFGLHHTDSDSSRKSRSLIQESLSSADESDDEIRRKSHHQIQPQPCFFSVREVNRAEEEAEEFSLRHFEKDDVAGKLARPSSALRAITMPCQRTIECNANATENINRSNSYPFGQLYDDYSPCRHIHPKLPDYDELAAKFMELKRANLEKNLDVKSR